jgi:hypothetical protein
VDLVAQDVKVLDESAARNRVAREHRAEAVGRCSLRNKFK